MFIIALLALCVGVLVGALVVFWLTQDPDFAVSVAAWVFVIAAPLLVLGSFISEVAPLL